jgi:hypothetical protein
MAASLYAEYGPAVWEDVRCAIHAGDVSGACRGSAYLLAADRKHLPGPESH